MVGLSQGYDQLILRGSPDTDSFSAFYLKNGLIIAADTVNRPPEFMLAKRIIAERLLVAPEQLADDSVPLKSFLPPN
jgi:3-phenylpropionate/trans-cinnamate dioxygenase ferredoxin reductase subunit